MQTIEQIKRRIQNGQDLLSIVKTMKSLAALNIRQYERAVESLADYNRTVEMGFQVLLRDHPNGFEPVSRPSQYTGVVIFGSDQGMCGSFNEQIVSFAIRELGRLHIPKGDRLIVAIGARTIPYLESSDQPIDEGWTLPGSTAGITPFIQDVVLKIDAWRAARGVNRVMLFHHRPGAGSSYRAYMHTLLPLNLAQFERQRMQEWPSRTLPIFTMPSAQLLSALIQQYVFVSLYRAFAESLMSENANRLATMQAAERNIEDHLDALNGEFHRQRQRAITEELLDVVAGFEALTGDA